jgi:hypothetical protein
LGEVKEGIDNVWNAERTQSLRRALLSHNFNGFSFCRACIARGTGEYA